MIKKLSLLMFSILLFCWSASAQKYYYSGNQKVYLTEDTSQVMAYFKKNVNTDKYNANKQLSINTVGPSKEVTVFKGNFDSKSSLKALESDSSVLYSYHALYNETAPIIPTGEILLALKDGVTLNDLLEKTGYLGKVEVIPSVLDKLEDNLGRPLSTSTPKMIILKSTKDSSFIIANKFYESNLTLYAHPNFYTPLVHHGQPLPDLTSNVPHSFSRSAAARLAPNDPAYPYQANLPYINADSAWFWLDYVRTASTPGVVVIDEGVDSHEDLNVLAGSGLTIKNNILTGKVGSSAKFHGEACAGLIAAIKDNNLGLVGVAPGLPIKSGNIFYGGETVADVAQTIQWAWANSGYSVISNSWGYPTTSGSGYDAVTTQINNAMNAGCIVVFASGNNSGAVTYPGNLPNVLTVGAITATGTRMPYSNYGPSMDLVAPVDYLGLITTDRMGADGQNSGNYYNNFDGTSAACPQVAAAAALIRAVWPTISKTNLENALKNSATDLGTAGYDNETGFGRLNVLKALALAMQSMASIEMVSFPTDAETRDYYVPAAVNPWLGSTSAPYKYTWTTSPYGNTICSLESIPGYPDNSRIRVRRIYKGGVVTTPFTVTFGPIAGVMISVTKTLAINNPMDPEWRMAAPTGDSIRLDSVNLNTRQASDSVVSSNTVELVASPVPASNSLTVKLNQNSTTSKINGLPDLQVLIVELTEVGTGRTVVSQKFSSGNTTVNLNVGGLQRGYYILRAFNGKKWFSKKITLL